MFRAVESALHNAMLVPFVALNKSKPVTVGGAKIQTMHAPRAAIKQNKFWGPEAAHVVYTPINDLSTQKSVLPVSGGWFDQPVLSNIAPHLTYLCVRAERTAGDVEFLGAAYNRAEAEIEMQFRRNILPLIQLVPQLIKIQGVANTMTTIYHQSLRIFSHENFIRALENTHERIKMRKGQHQDCHYCLPVGSEPSKLSEFYIDGNGEYSLIDLSNVGDPKFSDIIANGTTLEKEVKEVIKYNELEGNS